MADDILVTRDLLTGDARAILRSLREAAAAARSTKLPDVKARLEGTLALDFDDYFLFLRKHAFIALHEGSLTLTTDGDGAIDGEAARLDEAIGAHFADRIEEEPGVEEEADENTDAGLSPLPPPPPPLPLTHRAPPPPPAAARDELPPPRPESRPEPPPAVTPGPASAILPRPASPIGRISITSPTAREPHRTPTQELPVATAPTSPLAARGTELDLRFVRYDALGSGALGTVYRGKHQGLGLEVAIKELRDLFGYFSFLQRGEVVKRLKKELSAQAQIRHPNVVQLFDQNVDVARPWFAMELCGGGSLRARLDASAGKGLPVETALRLFLQLAYALEAAHAMGVVHQGLKPENVLFDDRGNVKLSDFGLTRVIEVDASKGLPQVFLGSGAMAYLPPELLGKPGAVAGPEADVYSLGILLYELLTGSLPGRRSPLPSAVNRDVPQRLDPIFDKMTTDKREDRYAAIGPLLDDFYAAFPDRRFLRRGDLVLFAVAPEARKEEPKRDEPKKDEPKKDEPAPDARPKDEKEGEPSGGKKKGKAT